MLQSRKYALNAPQPGERVTITTTTAMKTAVERRAIATARASFETWAVAPPRIRELRLSFSAYFRTGAPVALASQMRWRVLIVPFAHSRSSALLTHGVSLLPFGRTSPKRSLPPDAALN